VTQAQIPFRAGWNEWSAVTKRLLIIDDDVDTTEAVGLAAGGLGMEFTAVNTSLTATEVFIAYQPDVVILDIIMPEKDGIDVLNDILNTGIPTRIVLTTGLSEGYLRLGQSIAKFHGVERIQVLRKPFRLHELVESLTTDAPATAGNGRATA
jgi:CheY-like chemotaxis protein